MIGFVKRLLPWIATSILSITIIVVTKGREGAPMQGSVSNLISYGSYPVSSGLKAFALWSENKRLRLELAEQALLRTELNEIRRENNRLREMLDFETKAPYKLIASEVIGFTSEEGVRGLLIARGADDGIRPDMAVISPDGLVGRIYRVHSNSAAVQLLHDLNLGVAARLVHAQESGIVHAAASGRLSLDGVPVSAAAAIGDSVVTSGQGGVFPAGILIGFTVRVASSVEGWLLQVDIKPSVDVRRLQDVFVIREANPLE